MTLTILTVTECADYARPFLIGMEALADDIGADLVIAADGHDAYRNLGDLSEHGTLVFSDGYLESVLDQAVSRCVSGHILRLDDDEECSPEMVDWLRAGEYEQADHWAFPRLNLYPDADHYAVGCALYPDLQTRLSVKAKAGGRPRIHDGSPYGTGTIAPCHLEHHKFLVRSREERWRDVERYERLQAGAGAQFVQFSVPEDLDPGLIQVRALERVPA